MAYNYNSENYGELSFGELNKPMSWPTGAIGEEMARENGFVNDRHGGSDYNGDVEILVEDLDKVAFNPDFNRQYNEQAYKDISTGRGRR